jgi:hypothetical protein
MPASGRFAIGLLVTLSILATACGNGPPEKEMQQAQAAMESARSAGAETHARDELRAAENALKQAHDAVAQRDYRLALNHALDSREHAQTAVKRVADIRAKERADADRALSEANTALVTARARLDAATAARASARSTSAAQRAIVALEAAVQEARAALNRGEVTGVAMRVAEPTAHLRATTRDLDAFLAGAGRRRRS